MKIYERMTWKVDLFIELEMQWVGNGGGGEMDWIKLVHWTSLRRGLVEYTMKSRVGKDKAHISS